MKGMDLGYQEEREQREIGGGHWVGLESV